jgi:hypothetical protein
MNYRNLLIIAAISTSALSNANLIQNGNFTQLPHALTQVSGQGKWDYYANSISGWYSDTTSLASKSPKPYIEVGQADVYGVTGEGIKKTTNVLELDSNKDSEVSQKISGLKKDYTYTISFLYADRAGTAPETNDFAVLWDNHVVHQFDFTSKNFSTTMKDYSFKIESSDPLGKLSFLGDGKSDSYGSLITDVEMTGKANYNPHCPAVPEPTSMAALACGVLGFVRRKRAKA